MTPLTQQLEDKKKELILLKKGCHNYDGCDEMDLRCWEDNLCQDCDHKVIVCKAEIAILEQAIAEMQKRDKEEIEWIEGKIKLFKEIHSLSGIHIELGFLDRIEQLQSQQTSKEIVSSSELANADISNLLQKELNNAGLTYIKGFEDGTAEMQKQRQEILDEIGYKIFSEDEQKSNNVWYKKGWDDSAKRINKVIQEVKELNCLPMNYIEINEKIDKLVEEQLNQPKKEQ